MVLLEYGSQIIVGGKVVGINLDGFLEVGNSRLPVPLFFEALSLVKCPLYAQLYSLIGRFEPVN